MRGLLLLAALTSGCLSAPPGGIAGDDGGAGDAGGRDASTADAGGPCPALLSLPLTSEADLAGWSTSYGANCAFEVGVSGLEFTNLGPPAICRTYRDRLVDLSDNHLRVRLIEGNPELAMSFTLVLGSTGEFDQRRWIYFERDDRMLYFGECGPGVGGGCVDTFWGSVTYEPIRHTWLRLRHDPENELLVFETSEGGAFFDLQAAADGVTAADVACAGVDLGSYENTGTDGVYTSSFIFLSTD